MAIPLTRSCSECEGEMELLTVDDGGETVIYECPECGHQIEIQVDTEEDDQADDGQNAEEGEAAVEELLRPDEDA